MLSIYEQTKQGQGTRSHILSILKQTDGLTRNELVERSDLTYEQVRRQTRNLHISGLIESRLVDGQRRYFIKKVRGNNLDVIFLAVLFVALVPILEAPIHDDDVRYSRHTLTSS